MGLLTPRHTFWLYLAVLPAPTFVHDVRVLAGALLAALLLSGVQRWRILKRSVLAILAFNLSVSLGVVLVGLWRGHIDSDWLFIANLRVLLMVYLGFWFIAKVDLVAAVKDWPTLLFITTLAIGQMRVFERLIRDCRFAFASRAIIRPRLIDRHHHAGAMAVALLDKAQAQATDVALAMRSRGAFD